MTSLVVGAGMVGSQALRQLVRRGERPVAYELAANEENIEGLAGKVEFVEGDVRDLAQLVETLRAHRITRILHTVALVGPAAEASPYEAYQTNVTGSVNVLEAARLVGVKRVVSYASNAIFDPDGGDAPFDEAYPKKPAGMNGAAKLCVEHVGEIYAKSLGLEFVSLRIGGVYGPGRSSGGVPQQMRACVEAHLRGGPYVMEKYVYVGRNDMITAHDAALGGLCALDAANPGLYYNIGTGEAYSYDELAAAMRALLPGLEIEVREAGRPVTIGMRPMLTARAERELGFRAEQPFALGFRNFVEWVAARESRWRG